MPEKARKISAATMLAALAACAAPSFDYLPPSDLTPQTGASIIGSTTIDPDPLAPDTHVFLSEVDNLHTQMGWHDWDKPVLVTPGTHLLTFGPCRCGNWLENYGGVVTLSANFAAGETYTLKSTLAKANGLGTSFSATAWIADASGVAITPKTSVELGPPGSGLYR